MPHIHFGILGVEREQHVHPSRGRYANGEIEAGQSRVLLPVPLPAVFLPPAVASPAEPRSDHLLKAGEGWMEKLVYKSNKSLKNDIDLRKSRRNRHLPKATVTYKFLWLYVAFGSSRVWP